MRLVHFSSAALGAICGLVRGETEQRAQRTKLVVFDVDGVLTDGRITYTDRGDEIKSFNAQDGSAIKRLMENGIEVALITGRESPIVARRADELGIRHLYASVADKAGALAHLLDQLGLDHDACAYVGDDLPDLHVFERVGFAISVPNGAPEARRAAHHVTERAGGAGVASEICRLILTAQGRRQTTGR